jgi:16S rRNA (adenine1518-N6/adenine1519-N6)-dimethyltransferase
MTMGRREVLDLLAANGLRPSRALGQNFVADGNTVRRIAKLAGVGPGDHVVEIGAGLGALTLALAETGAAVTAVEVDRHLVPVLESVVAGRGVTVVHADARTLDWSAVLAGAEQWVLVANLPYNVATPLVLELLEGVPAIDRMLVMVQREVGERLAAGVGDDAYGAVSVKVGYWATAAVVGKVRLRARAHRPPGRPRRRRALRTVRGAGAGRVRYPSQDAAPGPGRDGRSGCTRSGGRGPRSPG